MAKEEAQAQLISISLEANMCSRRVIMCQLDNSTLQLVIFNDGMTSFGTIFAPTCMLVIVLGLNLVGGCGD